MTADTIDFWEQPEQVERFAARQADKRLVKLIESYEDPGQTRILDLGCAAGRNAVLLAERGFDFYAMDSSQKMVQKTRERVGSILNSGEAKKRLLGGRMDDLQIFQTNSFHLVIALGLYQNATSQKEFEAALAETARVLMPSGQLLVANFSPRCSPNETALRKSPSEEHVYEGFAAAGIAIVFASSEMAEILSIADRILVLHQGRIAGELPGESSTEESVMRLATGAERAGRSA